MPKILEKWTVLPHGPLQSIDDGILTVTGDIPMPLGNFPRRMTVVRLGGWQDSHLQRHCAARARHGAN